VTCPEETDECVIISSGQVEVSPRRKPRRCLVNENQAIALDFVRFFEPSQAGIEVLPHAKGVRVKAVAENKRFSVAGVRSDDVLLAADATDITSAEQFRRLLRRKLAEEKETTFKVLRGEKTIEVRIPMKE